MKKPLIALAVLAAFAGNTAFADTLLSGFGGDRGFGSRVMDPNDDGSSERLALPFQINFFR